VTDQAHEQRRDVERSSDYRTDVSDKE